jgi:hypothetical protein
VPRRHDLLRRASRPLDLSEIRAVTHIPHEIVPKRDGRFRGWRREYLEIGRLPAREHERRRPKDAVTVATLKVIVTNLQQQRAVFKVTVETIEVKLRAFGGLVNGSAFAVILALVMFQGEERQIEP